jgi:hypothetical protein
MRQVAADGFGSIRAQPVDAIGAAPKKVQDFSRVVIWATA